MKKPLAIAAMVAALFSTFSFGKAFADDLQSAHAALHDVNATPMAGSTQDLTPPKQIEMYLDGFHCIKSELGLPAEKQRSFFQNLSQNKTLE